ncbi:MAG: flagellar motor switch protein FliM [Bacillota bacterium]|jgi:flagellar motor switch protein FliM
MKDVLSQQEIDMLLSTLAEGDVGPTEIYQQQSEIKSYDFRRPNKFSKDQLRTLHMIHDNFARMLSNFLSAYVRANFQIKIASVDQITYEDFLVSIPTPTLITVFSMTPLKGKALLETSPAFFFPIIDLLFGGTGEVPKKLRELTDIEINVLKRVNLKILEQLAFSWVDIFKFEPEIESMDTNPQFNQIISPNEIVSVITFSTTVGKFTGLMNLCLPFLTLEDVISKLTARYWFSSPELSQTGAFNQELVHCLEAVTVPLMAVCGKAQITLSEFLELQVGDVVSLDTTVGDDLSLLVDEIPKYKVQPGVVGNRLAVQVTGIVKEESGVE